MKNRLVLSVILFICLVVFPGMAKAEMAVIKDIVITSEGNSVKISIVSNKAVQIEAFKNDESPANYIVLDFLGSVYTKLPSGLKVDKGVVEKVNLVRGEEKQVQIEGEDYYALDFMAINLNAVADYQMHQSELVIDLNIGSVPEEGALTGEGTVNLTPAIVISKEKADAQEEALAIEKQEKDVYAKDDYESLKAAQQASDEAAQGTDKKKKKRKFLGLFRGKKKTADAEIRKKIEPEQTVLKAQDKPILESKAQTIPAQKDAAGNYLIDKIVEETVQEREQVNLRIEDMTMELKKIQEELSLSTGEKSKIESKINEILAKLDSLKNALDAEIQRRQLLGERVEDLIAKRESYVRAKKAYEDLGARFSDVSGRVDNLNYEMQAVKTKLDVMQFEKKKIEGKVDAISQDMHRAQSGHEGALKRKEELDLTIDQLSVQIRQLQQKLDSAMAEKSTLTLQLKELESKNRYSDAELSRLSQQIADKNAFVNELLKKYEQLKSELDTTVSEKLKLEVAYQNAKSEFESIRSEVEKFLDYNKR